MRMWTGTPEWRPTPDASTGRSIVVSRRNKGLFLGYGYQVRRHSINGDYMFLVF
jgi:hypothetical protein